MSTYVGATGGRPILENETSSPKWKESVGNHSSSSAPHGPDKRSLASFIAGFKSASAKLIAESSGVSRAPVWQRNYHEHIIRNEKNLIAIRHYIRMNPSNWASDPENPFSGPQNRGRPPVAPTIARTTHSQTEPPGNEFRVGAINVFALPQPPHVEGGVVKNPSPLVGQAF